MTAYNVKPAIIFKIIFCSTSWIYCKILNSFDIFLLVCQFLQFIPTLCMYIYSYSHKHLYFSISCKTCTYFYRQPVFIPYIPVCLHLQETKCSIMYIIILQYLKFDLLDLCLQKNCVNRIKFFLDIVFE